ncbi:hypothetical protein HN51_060092, partial [Arachis hypogaea]
RPLLTTSLSRRSNPSRHRRRGRRPMPPWVLGWRRGMAQAHDLTGLRRKVTIQRKGKLTPAPNLK